MVLFNATVFVDMVGWYVTGGWVFVDLLIYILIFGGITQFTLGRKAVAATAGVAGSGHEGGIFSVHGKPAIIGITAALSFSLVAVESAAGITLIALGPFAALLLAIMLMIFVRELVKQVYDKHQIPLISGIIAGLFALDSLWLGILAIAPSQAFLSKIHFSLSLGTVLLNILIFIALFMIIKEAFAAAGTTPGEAEAEQTLSSGGTEGAEGPISTSSATPPRPDTETPIDVTPTFAGTTTPHSSWFRRACTAPFRITSNWWRTRKTRKEKARTETLSSAASISTQIELEQSTTQWKSDLSTIITSLTLFLDKRKTDRNKAEQQAVDSYKSILDEKLDEIAAKIGELQARDFAVNIQGFTNLLSLIAKDEESGTTRNAPTPEAATSPKPEKAIITNLSSTILPTLKNTILLFIETIETKQNTKVNVKYSNTIKDYTALLIESENNLRTSNRHEFICRLIEGVVKKLEYSIYCFEKVDISLWNNRFQDPVSQFRLALADFSLLESNLDNYLRYG